MPSFDTSDEDEDQSEEEEEEEEDEATVGGEGTRFPPIGWRSMPDGGR